MNTIKRAVATLIICFITCLLFQSQSPVKAWSVNDDPVLVAKTTPSEKLYFPYGIFVSNTGKIYATESNTPNDISVIDINTGVKTKWDKANFGGETLQALWKITGDNNGCIYVTDAGDNTIKKFTEQGVFVKKWGGAGANPGQFNGPRGIFYYQGHIYAADRYNKRIQKFNLEGDFVSQFGVPGTGNGQMQEPYDLVIKDDYIYVTDMSTRKIQKFDMSGVYQYGFGGYGSADGLFNQPVGIGIDNDNNIYITDLANKRVQKFTNAGVFIRKWGSNGFGKDFLYSPRTAVVNDNKVFVADDVDYVVKIYDLDGNFLDFSPKPYDDANNFGRNASDATFDSQGNIYIVDWNIKVKVYNSQLQYQGEWALSGTGPGKARSLRSITIYNDYALLASGESHKMLKYDLKGNFLMEFGSYGSTDGLFNSPLTCDVLPISEDIYVLDFYNRRIQVFDKEGHFKFKFGTSGTGPGQLGASYAVQVDPTRGVYILDLGNNKIHHYTLTGGFVNDISFAGETLSGDMKLLPDGTAIIGISGGFLFVDSDFQITHKWSSTLGNGDNQFKSVLGISYYPQTQSFVFADAGNARLKLYRYDRTAPTGGITINGGASTATGTSVTLKLPVSDDLSGVTEMIVSSNPSFEGMPWESYKATRGFTLTSNEGVKNIFVKYRDAKGNESETYKASITLAYIVPTASPTVMPTPTVTADQTVVPTPSQIASPQAESREVVITIVDENSKPLASTNVTLDGKSFTTDSQGVIRISSLQQGTHTIIAMVNGVKTSKDFILGAQTSESASNVTVTLKAEANSFWWCGGGIILLLIIVIAIYLSRRKHETS